MRILHIITSLRTGGAERLVADLAWRLCQSGDEVAVLLFDGTRTPLMDGLEERGVSVHALSEGGRAMRNPALVFRLGRFLRRNRFDVVHTHNTSCQFLAAAVSMWIPVTLVTTEHSTTNRRRGNRFLRWADRWMYGRYRRIACVSEDTCRSLAGWLPMTASKTVVIPNGVALDRFRDVPPDPEMARTGRYRILMAAAFREPKDQATLIRAVSILPPEYHLFLAGGAELQEDKEKMQSCKALAEGLGLGSRVHFLGVRSDVPSLLAATDVSVLSSRWEGLSISAVESMASGKPFIASDVTGLDTLVGGAGLLFPAGDAYKLAEWVRRLCEDPSEARTVGARCRARSLQFDIAETARRYRLLYESL